MRVQNRPRATGHRASLSVNRAAKHVQEVDVLVKEPIHVEVRGCAAQDALGAVLVKSPLDSLSNQVQSLIPRDALPFVNASQLAVRVIESEALALHGILNARRREHLADLGAPSQAAAPLRVRIGILIRLVRAHLQGNTVLNVHLVEAAGRSTAVVPAWCTKPFSRLSIRVSLATRARRAARETNERYGARRCSAPFDEASTSQRSSHVQPPLFLSLQAKNNLPINADTAINIVGNRPNNCD